MEKEQTAVQWLINEHFGGIENCTPDFRFKIEQALKMEKDQILKSHVQGQWAILNKKGGIGAMEYYNEISGAKSEWVKVSE